MSSLSSSSSQDWLVARPPDNLADLRKSAPWMQDPKWFESVVVSPSAVVKMLAHCDSGVQKGIAKGGNPIEVMGMLLGRPNGDRQLVVTDAFPLPIEGFETRVVADDQAVVNHMISLGESLERTRSEKFMGWYHSHPFPLASFSHCFLSSTDLSTQLQWQRSEDPHGNPFVAIVIDPLRTHHLQEPVLKAFRAYPPEYAPASPSECPDGAVEASEQVRLERWGSCWNRYYELDVRYHMTPACRRILEQLTSDSIWIRNLSSAVTSPDAEASRLKTLALQCRSAHSTLAPGVQATAAAGPIVMSAAPSSSSSHTTVASQSSAETAEPAHRALSSSSSRAPIPPPPRASSGAAATPGTRTRPSLFARSEEAMAALTVASSSNQPIAGSGRAGNQGPGGGGGPAAPPAPATTTPEWTKAVQAVVDAAEEAVCHEHRNATKARVFG